MEYTVGCDPELFVFNNKTHKFISAFPMIKGTKENPYKVPKGATQVDGVLAEFNIDPVTNEEDFSSNIIEVMLTLKEQLNNEDLVLQAVPVGYFEEKYFNSLSQEETILGCMPDFNAYTGKQNTPPHTKETFRTGSGHVHFGYETNKETYEEDVRNRVKQLDNVLYLSSLLWDEDDKRRTLYGKPGAFRYKPYGFEYRPLSNRWLKDMALHKWVFDSSIKAMNLYDEGVYMFDESPVEERYERESLLSYHKHLVNVYGIRELPWKYLI